jgi:hypothetical protein
MEDEIMSRKEISGLLCELQSQFEETPVSLSAMETQIERLLQRVGREMIQQYLIQCEKMPPDPRTRCRHCGDEADYVSKKTACVKTGLGLIRYRRAYYVCPSCNQTTYPLDERLDPYESLARLRHLIRSGQSLPVGELASAWGLGALKATSAGGQNGN